MLAALSPLRDRSNDAALSPVGNGTPKTKSRLGGGVTPTPKPKAKASAMRASSKNPFRDSVRRTSTPSRPPPTAPLLHAEALAGGGCAAGNAIWSTLCVARSPT